MDSLLEKKNWLNAYNKRIKNIDLWIQLEKLTQNHILHWYWIKGHSGHFENEICDKIAKKSALNPNIHDVEYKKYIL